LTRGALKTRVGRILGIYLASTDSDSATDIALLEELANEAVVDILSRTRVHVLSLSINLSAGATEYTFDTSQVLRVIGVQYQGIDSTTPTEIFKADRDTLVSNEFAFPGFERIMFGQAAVAGDVLLVQQVPAPTPMTNDAHDPSAFPYGNIPSRFHRAIINYMLWHAADRGGDSGSSRGERYRILYEGKQGLEDPGSDLGRIKTFVNLQGGATRIRTPRPALIGDRYPKHWQG
jgi:hypothetical protein